MLSVPESIRLLVGTISGFDGFGELTDILTVYRASRNSVGCCGANEF